MSPADAAKILDLPADTSPEQLEARFQELRQNLEDKIAKAPTPGLKAKYRDSLAEITTAFETLTLAADTSSLPVAQKQSTGGGVPSPRTGSPGGGAISPAASVPSGLRSQVSGLSPSPRQKSGGKEFALVAIIAVLVLAGGGWFVLKTRAENAEKARLAAEAKAAEAKAAESEKARLEQVKVQLRTALAEAKIAWEVAEREERDAERRTSELRSELRGLRDEKPGQRALLEARADSAQAYSTWIRDHLLRHPMKLARARTEELLQAGAIADAGTSLQELKDLAASLQAELSANPGGEGALEITTNLPVDIAWELNGPAGFTRSGSGPRKITGLLFGAHELTVSGPTLTGSLRKLTVAPGRVTRENIGFFRVRIKGLEPGDVIKEEDRVVPALADGTYPVNDGGPVVWEVHRPGHLPRSHFRNWALADDEFEIDPLVPLEPRALAKEAVRLLANYRGNARLGVPALLSLVDATARGNLLPPEERARLLSEYIRQILDEPAPPAAVAEGDRSARVGAVLRLGSALHLLDSVAAGAALREAMDIFDRLPFPEQLKVDQGSWALFSEYPESAGMLIRAFQRALMADPARAKDSVAFGAAANVHGLLRVLGRTAEAESWKASLWGWRDAQRRGADEAVLVSFENFLRGRHETAALRAALHRDDVKEFNRLAATFQGTPAASPYYDLLIYELLKLGRERQALAFAASINNCPSSAFREYSRRRLRPAAFVQYASTRRGYLGSGTDFVGLAVAEMLAKQGDTDARNWLKKSAPDASAEKLLVMALLKDPATGQEFDKYLAAKPSLSLASIRNSLVATARILGSPDREQAVIAAYGRPIELPSSSLARIGDKLGARKKLRGGHDDVMEYYLLLSEWPHLRNQLPLFMDGDLDLAILHLYRLAPDPRDDGLAVPYPEYTPAQDKGPINPSYPAKLRREGIAGEARIRVLVDRDGRATGYETISTTAPEFAEELFKAAEKTGFHPALKRGQPVEGDFVIARSFRL